MKKLWISSIDDTFDPKNDILMGPWCLFGNEQYLLDYKKLNIIPDPFQTSKDLAFHEKLTSDFARNYMPILTKLLNDINRTKYSEKFWHTIAFDWLIHLVQSTWERQLRINYILRNYKNDTIAITLMKNNSLIEFEDTKSFIYDGVFNQKYNQWIFSRLFESNTPNSWQVVWIDAENIGTGKEKKENSRNLLSKSFKQLFLFSRVQGIRKVEAIFWLMLFRFKKPLNSSNLHFGGKTNKFEALPMKINFKDLVVDTMPNSCKNIPVDPSKSSRSAKRMYFIGAFPSYNEELKLRIAKKIEQGTSFITTQHGGHYGNAKVFPIAPYTEYNQYAFFSWGWREQEDYGGNIIDLPSPFLSELNHQEKEDKIIFVSMGSKPMLIRIYANPQPLQQLENINSRIKFIRSINEKIRDNFFYRPFENNDIFFNDPPWPIKKEFPDLNILKGKLNKRLMSCRLLILDHPGTTLNIALAANVPTICLWDFNYWAMCRQAEPYFDNLQKAGIIFSDPIEAGEFVNDISYHVQDWWNQETIQTARKNWTWQFARTSKNWRWEWIKAIRNL